MADAILSLVAAAVAVVAAVAVAAAVAAVAVATSVADTNPRQFQHWGKLPSAAVMEMAESNKVQPSKDLQSMLHGNVVVQWQLRWPQPTGHMGMFQCKKHGGNSTPGRILHQSMVTQNQRQQTDCSTVVTSCDNDADEHILCTINL